MSWLEHIKCSWIAEVHNFTVVRQKRPSRPKETWDDVLINDRQKLGMDFADSQKNFEGRGRLRRRLMKEAYRRGKPGFKTDVMRRI